MSDKEIEEVVDDFFNKTPKETLIDIFEKAGFFKEFSQEEINWEIFIPILSKSTFSSFDNQNIQWNIETNNFIAGKMAA